MKKTLLATAAVAALVGFTTIATAQNAMDSKGAAKPSGASGAEIDCTRRFRRCDDASAIWRRDTGACSPRARKRPSPTSAWALKKSPRRPPRSARRKSRSPKPRPRSAVLKKSRSPKPRSAAPRANTAPTRKRRKKSASRRKKARKARRQSPAPANRTRRKVKSKIPPRRRTPQGQRSSCRRISGSKIHSMLGKSEGASVTNVNFNISVGVTVPRDVHVEVLPEDVVEVVPQYEGYDYIVVNDEILIIDPDSLGDHRDHQLNRAYGAACDVMPSQAAAPHRTIEEARGSACASGQRKHSAHWRRRNRRLTSPGSQGRGPHEAARFRLCRRDQHRHGDRRHGGGRRRSQDYRRRAEPRSDAQFPAAAAVDPGRHQSHPGPRPISRRPSAMSASARSPATTSSKPRR